MRQHSPNMHFRCMFILSLIALSCMFSCGKLEGVEPDSIKNTSQLRGNDVLKLILNIKDLEAQNIAYSTLPDEDRYYLWDAKLTKAASDPQYSDAQKEKIKEFNRALTVDFFTNTDKKEIFKASVLGPWIEENRNLFTGTEIYYLIFSINPQPPIKSSFAGIGATISGEDPPAHPSFCKCAVGSSFTCPTWVVFPTSFLGWGICEKKSYCVPASTGCGGLNEDQCDGDFCNLPYT